MDFTRGILLLEKSGDLMNLYTWIVGYLFLSTFFFKLNNIAIGFFPRSVDFFQDTI